MEIRKIPLEDALTEGVYWLVKLRWFVGSGVFLLGLVTTLVLPGIRLFPLAVIGATIIAYNFAVRTALGHLGPHRGIHLQITLDWIALALVCHFTMGLESPFIAFFILHVIVASLFVSRRSCIRHGMTAMFLMTFVVVLEYTGVLPMPSLPDLGHGPRHGNVYFIIFALGAFYCLILLTIFLATSVVKRLRQGEERQLELEESLGRSYRTQIENDQARMRFIRIASHEIRSPLSAIQSMLQVIIDGYAGEIGAKAKEMVNRSEQRLLLLLELVNELLDLIRGLQPVAEEDKSDINLRESIAKTLSDVAAKAEGKEVRLVADLDSQDVIFRGDPQSLERVIRNLLDNAIKYTPEFGTVTVSGRRLPVNFYLFEVRDTGIGIPADELPRVFEEFYRASNAKKEKKEGTGLGLSIVKKTVEKYGGQVSVTSEVGKGSCFSVRLPVITIVHNN